MIKYFSISLYIYRNNNSIVIRIILIITIVVMVKISKKLSYKEKLILKIVTRGNYLND